MGRNVMGRNIIRTKCKETKCNGTKSRGTQKTMHIYWRNSSTSKIILTRIFLLQREMKMNKEKSINFFFHFMKSAENDMDVDRRIGSLWKRITLCISLSSSRSKIIMKNRNKTFTVYFFLQAAENKLNSCRKPSMNCASVRNQVTDSFN